MEAQALASTLGDEEQLLVAAIGIGEITLGMGAYEQTLDAWQQAVALAERLGDAPARALSLAYLGASLRRAGEVRVRPGAPHAGRGAGHGARAGSVLELVRSELAALLAARPSPTS